MGIIDKAFFKATSKETGFRAHEIENVSQEISPPPEEKQLDTEVSGTPVDPLLEKNKQNRFEINWERLAEMGFLTPKDTNTRLVEEMRNIKRPLLENAFGAASSGIKRPNLVLVTSSVPGEGKTFNAINLAISITHERDKNVLLIDADVARPSISKTLGINATYGLIDYLERTDIRYTDIELSTNLPGLSIIAAGKLHRYSTELLSSKKMADFAAELSSRYPDRIVIFDSPPLLAATQADVLAKLVGQVVFVVEAEQTLQNMVKMSVDKLSSCDVVLVVLNKTFLGPMGGYYGYGYGYGYGHYGRQSSVIHETPNHEKQ